MYMRMHRWNIFWSIDKESYTYRGSDAGIKQRLKEEEKGREYIRSKAPKEYHEILTPDFEMGCKRKIADPGYLESLNWPNVELIPEGLQKITPDGIVSSSGREDEYDIIVLGTGFKVSQFMTPMEVIGANGQTLEQQWKEHRGAQAYLGTFVHNFPNMAILYVFANALSVHRALLTEGQIRTKHLSSQQLGSVRLRSASRLRCSRSHQAVDGSTG